MKTTEFEAKRNVRVSTDQGVFEFSSYANMCGFFTDIENHEQWAKAHENAVFVCHRFDTIGKIVERFETNSEAEIYAGQLNDYFAICEEFIVEEF